MTFRRQLNQTFRPCRWRKAWSTAVSGGVTVNTAAQATALISSYVARVAAIERQVRQTVTNVQPHLENLATATING